MTNIQTRRVSVNVFLFSYVIFKKSYTPRNTNTSGCKSIVHTVTSKFMQHEVGMCPSFLFKLKEGSKLKIILSLLSVWVCDKHSHCFISRLVLVLSRSRMCVCVSVFAKTLDYNLISTHGLIHSVVRVCVKCCY